MDPQEALNMLDQVAANVQTNRATHFQIQQALGTLQKLVDEKKSDADQTAPQDAQ